ncbi:MAG: spermidine synthase [Vicinamibacterales bacterium]
MSVAPILLALTVFASAFLLFLVQPLVAKQILPWFGGSAAVWTTCLVFFQVALLAGYAYSHRTTSRLTLRRQITLHGTLLILSLLSLPIIVGSRWKPAAGEDPTRQILWLLTGVIGLPYFLLSTTGPLVQAWFARVFAGSSVYRLFALSNLASLLALLAYPFLLEPWIPVRVQAWAWSIGYVVFAVLCLASGVLTLRATDRPDGPVIPQPSVADRAALVDPADEAAPIRRDQAMWLLLSALGSWLLLAVTNHITQNIASIPFLWIAPLSLYLLTFILAFDRQGWYRRAWLLPPLAAVAGYAAYGLQSTALTLNIKLAIPLYLALLFGACLFLHGELALQRPAPRHLTGFYLMIALGGALGALGVGVVAPQVFTAYYELGFGLVALAALAAVQLRTRRLAMAAALVMCGVTGYYWYRQIADVRTDARILARNFYGTLKTRDTGPADSEYSVRRLIHGIILHGEQYLAPQRRLEPTTYYSGTSGVGLAASLLIPQHDRRVGVIGLGTGTMAAWGRPGDVFRFYEINPQVIYIARNEFGFLREGQARSEIVVGDARLSLEREAPQGYDLLVIDAFSSDSIPTHLVTTEAMQVYLRHLKPKGIVAFHVTNRFLDLAPVVGAVAEANGLHAVLLSDSVEEDLTSATDWALVSRDPSVFEDEAIKTLVSRIEPRSGLAAWTDDFNNLFRILK